MLNPINHPKNRVDSPKQSYMTMVQLRFNSLSVSPYLWCVDYHSSRCSLCFVSDPPAAPPAASKGPFGHQKEAPSSTKQLLEYEATVFGATSPRRRGRQADPVVRFERLGVDPVVAREMHGGSSGAVNAEERCVS